MPAPVWLYTTINTVSETARTCLAQGVLLIYSTTTL